MELVTHPFQPSVREQLRTMGLRHTTSPSVGELPLATSSLNVSIKCKSFALEINRAWYLFARIKRAFESFNIR